MTTDLGSKGNMDINKDMRIKNLILDFPYYNEQKPTIYIDGNYIRTFIIDSVNHEMRYLDAYSWAWDEPLDTSQTGLNIFGEADFVALQIKFIANQKGCEGFASIFDFIAHSGCSIDHFSFDLIDMGCQDPERTIKHYDYDVDWKEGPGYISNNLNQKVGMDSEGNLCLVISEKYNLKNVFGDRKSIDMPDVIESVTTTTGAGHGYSLSAVLNPNKLRVLRHDADWHVRVLTESFRKDPSVSEEDKESLEFEMDARDPYGVEFEELITFSLYIDNNTIELSKYYADDISQYVMEKRGIEQLGPYIIASTLLNALNCCLGGQKYIDNESLYEKNLIDIEGRYIDFTLESIYGCKNSLDVTVCLLPFYHDKSERHDHINITEFIPELIAEINDELGFWSESNEEHKKVLINLMNRLMVLFANKIGLN